MVFRDAIMVLLTFALVGCGTGQSSLEKCSSTFKQQKDFTCLETIVRHLSKGTPREAVEHLLGSPDYSPTMGQYYYLSSRWELSEDHDQKISLGLVVDYRDGHGVVTESLQNFWQGPIGE